MARSASLVPVCPRALLGSQCSSLHAPGGAPGCTYTARGGSASSSPAAVLLASGGWWAAYRPRPVRPHSWCCVPGTRRPSTVHARRLKPGALALRACVSLSHGEAHGGGLFPAGHEVLVLPALPSVHWGRRLLPAQRQVQEVGHCPAPRCCTSAWGRPSASGPTRPPLCPAPPAVWAGPRPGDLSLQ